MQLTGKAPDAGKDSRQEEKRATEDEMVGWHHNRHESEQALGDGKGQGGLVCYSPWGCKESDTTCRTEQHLKFGDHFTSSPCLHSPLTTSLFFKKTANLFLSDIFSWADIFITYFSLYPLWQYLLSPIELTYHGIVLGDPAEDWTYFLFTVKRKKKKQANGKLWNVTYSLLKWHGSIPFNFILMCNFLLCSLNSLVLWVFPQALFVISSEMFIAETCLLLCNCVYPFRLIHVHARKIKPWMFEM